MKILSSQMSRYRESPEINVCANEPYAPGLKDTKRLLLSHAVFSSYYHSGGSRRVVFNNILLNDMSLFPQCVLCMS